MRDSVDSKAVASPGEPKTGAPVGFVTRFFADERAAEVTELSIALGLIVALSLALISSIGSTVKNGFNSVDVGLP